MAYAPGLSVAPFLGTEKPGLFETASPSKKEDLAAKSDPAAVRVWRSCFGQKL